MAVLHQYDHIFAIAIVFSALEAWNIGANDVANSFASTVSSRSLTLKQAMTLASICEFTGSISAGGRVMGTARTKIISPHHFHDAPDVLLLAMMSTIVASSIFLTIATRYGMPVSTTHSVVGGLVGTAAGSVGLSKVNWGWTGVARVITAWVAAPALAGVIGACLFLFTKFTVLSRTNAVKRAFFSIPFYTFVTVGAVTMLVVWGGIHAVILSTNTILISVLTAASAAALIQGFFIMPYLWVMIMREDWTLKWYHVFQGPFLLKRPLPPPLPPGYVRPQVTDYYRGHLTPEELACVRASENLLRSVQTLDGEPPSTDKDEEPVLTPALSSCSTIAPKRKSTFSEHHPRPRPPGSWKRPSVIWWRVSRFVLRGIEKDVVSMQKRNAILNWDIEDMHSRAARYDNRAEHMYTTLQVLTAAAASFTHGANDVSNAVAPLATAWEVWSKGRVTRMIDVPIWVLCFGGAAIVIGLVTFGYHVMRTLGNRLTLISPSRGFCMELASAVTVLVATRLMLPVSTTQCITGATVGVGLANGDWKSINPKLVGWIYLGWLITVPATGIIAGCLMSLLLNSPSWPTPA
ncbi:hypothetical protein CDD81_406 [Ophiocordyceps australis]|uniref:Phosphate transporter n=1 Tax=Ophiocordyceps australis TaxID=1399860 RepID=A0A2C5XVY0_9HYPO|nr:hypothetical protein CDD81_406 [Ophiocordyceps australis]